MKGTTRCVLFIGRWAVKLPILTLGIRQWMLGCIANMNEARWWKLSAGSKARPLLCPVLWSAPGGLLLVMPVAEPAPWNMYVDSLEDWMVEAEMANNLVGIDLKQANYGVLRGREVLLDYGNQGFGIAAEAFQ